LGQKVRKGLSIRKPEEALRVLVVLYKNIGITVEGELPGELWFSRCYFSEIYTRETCDVISAFDSGVVGGLMDGGSVVFSERITEGHLQCRACYCEKEFAV